MSDENIIPFPRKKTELPFVLDLNFYPEQQTETLKALPLIVVDCDLTGWTFYELVKCAHDAELDLWACLNDVDHETGEVFPRWKR